MLLPQSMQENAELLAMRACIHSGFSGLDWQYEHCKCFSTVESMAELVSGVIPVPPQGLC